MTMSKAPSISEAEWKVMKLLWRKSPQPAYDLAQVLCKTEDWEIRTVKTLLSRLVKKGALGYHKYKNLYLYYPIAKEEACIKKESQSFLNQVFDGSISQLLVHFAKQRKLSKEEVARLKAIVEDMED